MKLLGILERSTQFQTLVKGVSAGNTPFGCVGLSHIHKAHFATGLQQRFNAPVLLVTPDEPSAVRLFEDIRALLPDETVLHFPAKELMLQPAEAVSREYEFARLGCLEALRCGPA